MGFRVYRVQGCLRGGGEEAIFFLGGCVLGFSVLDGNYFGGFHDFFLEFFFGVLGVYQGFGFSGLASGFDCEG